MFWTDMAAKIIDQEYSQDDLSGLIIEILSSLDEKHCREINTEVQSLLTNFTIARNYPQR